MLDERARHELYLGLEHLLGSTRADTLMSLLPSVGWADVATKDDLRQLEERMSVRMDSRIDALAGSMNSRFDQLTTSVDSRFDQVDGRFDQLEAVLDARIADAVARADAKFAVVDARFEHVEGRFARVDARFSQLEGQLDRALREQTRTLMLGLVGAMFTMTSLCLGAVALAT